MLGRGHLSILRQGRSSWPDRESFINTPGTGREDMILMDQLERDSLPEFCPKSLPRKYFSPPKRPWDFSKASQPKRLWDLSPPFCKERLQVNTRSTRLIQDPREQCCRSLDTGGVCNTTLGGINSNRLSSVHRCATERLAENADNAAQRPQSTVSKCHVDEANVKQGFWKNDVAIPASVEQRAVEAAAQNHESDHYLPSTFHHQVQSDFTKAAAPDEQISMSASKLSAQIGFDIQEIERLKAHMALLCERLAWQISHWSKDPCKAAVSDSLDSDESLLLKGLEELKRVIGVPTANSESRREQGKDLDAGYNTEGRETEDMICRCRNLAWKRGIGTFFQSTFWCIGFMMTVVRCTQCSGPELIPT